MVRAPNFSHCLNHLVFSGLYIVSIIIWLSLTSILEGILCSYRPIPSGVQFMIILGLIFLQDIPLFKIQFSNLILFSRFLFSTDIDSAFPSMSAKAMAYAAPPAPIIKHDLFSISLRFV